MPTVLLTGGSGFIGSHTCLSLLEFGYNVIVIDSNINSQKDVLNRVFEIYQRSKKNNSNQLFFIEGDIRDYELLDNIFKKAKSKNIAIDAVIHLAGLKAVGDSIINPLEYWDTNVGGSISLFRAMEKNNCHTIVFSSSATIYASQEEVFSIKENADIKPTNPYGETKEVIEKILKNIFEAKKSKWKIANLRYFNPIGAHSSGLIGEEPNGIPNNIFPYICLVASGNLKKLEIFGNDWPTEDGTCKRDYIHIMDLADAHRCTLEYLLTKNSQLISLNIGTGIGTSVLELVKTFIEVNNCNFKYKFGKRRSGDNANVVANNELALKTLNWKPQRDIKDMCRDGWLWQSNRSSCFQDKDEINKIQTLS